MKRSVMLVLLPGIFLLTGCGGPTRMINGEMTEVLTPHEEIEMISIARATLAKSRRLNSAEQKFIRENDPVLKIRYTGDRTGDASVIWKLPDRKVTLLMRGTFFTPSAQWMMKINEDHPEFADFTRKNRRNVEKR